MMESQPMKAGELGRFVCVAHGGCLHSPKITIESDGVWVKTDGGQFTSAHADCFRAWDARSRGQVARLWIASGRNGYHVVDEYRPLTGSTGTFGNALIFRSRKDADYVAAALNSAYAAGLAEAGQS